MSNPVTLGELLAQKAALEQQIAEVQRAERSQAIVQVKALIAQFGLSAADIGFARPLSLGAPSAPVRAPKKLAAKYRNPETGETWSGRGLKPKWLAAALAAGRTLTDFAV